jgi:hypothetical protein
VYTNFITLAFNVSSGKIRRTIGPPDCDSGGRGFEPHRPPHYQYLSVIALTNFRTLPNIQW